jgi:hypothetical protein
MDKENVIDIYNVIFDLRKGDSAICDNMDELWGHYLDVIFLFVGLGIVNDIF